MRKLHLNRASADNADRFVDAGTDIGVGPADDHIIAERADELVAGGGAIEVGTPAPKPAVRKSGARKSAAKKAASIQADPPAPPAPPEPLVDEQVVE